MMLSLFETLGDVFAYNPTLRTLCGVTKIMPLRGILAGNHNFKIHHSTFKICR